MAKEPRPNETRTCFSCKAITDNITVSPSQNLRTVAITWNVGGIFPEPGSEAEAWLHNFFQGLTWRPDLVVLAIEEAIDLNPLNIGLGYCQDSVSPRAKSWANLLREALHQLGRYEAVSGTKP